MVAQTKDVKLIGAVEEIKGRITPLYFVTVMFNVDADSDEENDSEDGKDELYMTRKTKPEKTIGGSGEKQRKPMG